MNILNTHLDLVRVHGYSRAAFDVYLLYIQTNARTNSVLDLRSQLNQSSAEVARLMIVVAKNKSEGPRNSRDPNDTCP